MLEEIAKSADNMSLEAIKIILTVAVSIILSCLGIISYFLKGVVKSTSKTKELATANYHEIQLVKQKAENDNRTMTEVTNLKLQGVSNELHLFNKKFDQF